ncbi:MAG TPA: methylmalonyl Co-A mutase-associated GTPase MeaB [Egibacteraceae bacterium]|nr:methylmalonyl Co-A mutase-associated GTPase MeaB [Egibacteraceae bacterium]
MDSKRLVEAVLAGDRRALARLLTRIEDGSSQQVREAVSVLHRHAGKAHFVGITGAPGVGKSTLTSELIAEWRRRGSTVGVLAVDPSSPFSGGALLGDRVRMQDHALDAGVFVRSMASRGHLGGLSWAAPQALGVLDAAGFDVVAIETVGVGQAEVDIASIADTTVVVVAPGMGDAIQAAKAGILEIADVFCVNKADRPDADRTVQQLRQMQHLGANPSPAQIVRTVASAAEGIAELADAIAAHRQGLVDSGEIDSRRLARARAQVMQIALGAIKGQFARLGDGELADRIAHAVVAGELDPYSGADRLVAKITG